MKRLFALTLFALLAMPATAASFDCSRAESPLEKAICAYPDLGAADEAMAKAFVAARKKLSAPASKIVLDNQRRWIDFVSRACTETATPLQSGSYDPAAIDCLTTLYTNRKDALETIGAIGGVTVYPIDWFRVVADPDQESWSMVGTTVLSYPQIDGSGPDIRAFNAYAKSLIDPVHYKETDEENDGRADYDIKVTVTAVSAATIGVVINDWFYGHGAAHGNYAVNHGLFLRKEQRPLAAHDVFTGTTWALDLKPLVIERLKQAIEDETGETDVLWEDDLDGIENAIADPARWEISSDGIAFQFEPYEVTAYAFGAPQAPMSWDELRPWLAPDALTMLGYN